MSDTAISRRAVLATSAVAGLALSILPGRDAAAGTAGGGPPVRPFRVQIGDDALNDMGQRIVTTRWPDRETVDDASQGVPLVRLQALTQYWSTDYDWRRGEAALNRYPQFVTEIDGIDIHFLHARSPHADALPLIISHGWPGSVFEQLKVIEPLTNPTAHGGSAADAFHVVIPSLPGYGFSGKPSGIGWGPDRIARAWGVLMDRLGYPHYVAQGGDWGTPISSSLAGQHPPGLLGIHINLPAAVPMEVAAALAVGVRHRPAWPTTSDPSLKCFRQGADAAGPPTSR